MRARLGINNCFAVKRWPQPEDWAAVVRNELGLDLVELSLDVLGGGGGVAAMERGVESTRTALARHGLSVEATFTGLAAYSGNLLMHPDAAEREAAQRWYERVIDISVALGARATGGHVGAMSVAEWNDPQRRDERWSELRRQLAALSAHARAAGLSHLLVENLAAAREPATFAQIDDLLTDGDADHVPIRLCLDVGHQVVAGSGGAERDPLAWLQRYGRSLAEVQLQQSDAVADHHWPFTAAHNAEGRIDPAGVLDSLASSGVQEVLLILEVIPAFEADDAAVIAELQESVAVWRTAMAVHDGA